MAAVTLDQGQEAFDILEQEHDAMGCEQPDCAICFFLGSVDPTLLDVDDPRTELLDRITRVWASS